MRKIEISTSATVYKDVSELSNEDNALMMKAIEARKNAYAPYSKFNVGAALLLENDEIGVSIVRPGAVMDTDFSSNLDFDLLKPALDELETLN